MEELKNNLESEIKCSDSWTFVNNEDSDEGNVNGEIEEPSDSESLEVLHVEQAEPDRNFAQEDSDIEEDNNVGEDCTVKYSDNSCICETPAIHISSVKKERKYVHYPNSYINMWLSIVMVIAVAMTLGLGIGHYLGSKRFAKARDLIHHLTYENQILEQELADVVVKHKYCESNLQNKVTSYDSLSHDYDDQVCFADESPVHARYFKKKYIVNETTPTFTRWFTYINVDRIQNPFYRNNSLIVPTTSDYKSKLTEGDHSFNINSLSKFQKSFKKMLTLTSQLIFSELNSELMYFRSLLKKWVEFHENTILPANACEFNNCLKLETRKQLHEASQKNVTPASEINEESMRKMKNVALFSTSNFCVAKVNQCVLQEEKLKPKEPKCKGSSKAQLFCSLLLGNKHKSRKIYLKKSWKDQQKKIKGNHVFFIGKDKPQENSARVVSPKNFQDSNVLKEKGNKKPGKRNYSRYQETESDEKGTSQRYSKDDNKIRDNKHKYFRSHYPLKRKENKSKKHSNIREKKDNYKFKQYFESQKKERKRQKFHKDKNYIEKKSFKNSVKQYKKLVKLLKKKGKLHKKMYSRDYDEKRWNGIWGKKQEFDSSKRIDEWKIRNDNHELKQFREKGICKYLANVKPYGKYNHAIHSQFGCFNHFYSGKNKKNYNKYKRSVNPKYGVKVHPKYINFQKFGKERSKIYQIDGERNFLKF